MVLRAAYTEQSRDEDRTEVVKRRVYLLICEHKCVEKGCEEKIYKEKIRRRIQ